MIQPKRLLDGEGTDVERILLASGRAARPSARAKWRTGILFALVGIGTVSKAHAVALLGAKIRALTVAQWLALGASTGAAGWVAVHAKADVTHDPVIAMVDHAPRRVPAAPSVHVEAPRVAAPEPDALAARGVEAPASNQARSSVQAPPTASRPKRSATPAVLDAPVTERSIASEVDELDRARAALGSGEPKRAIERLNRYDRSYPQGMLREEALRLRIEAMVSAGERASARSLAQRFQARYPDSTHSDRLKALVREP
jgi:hypothetical protein